MIDNERFLSALAEAKSAIDNGIGTYGEKLLHRTLKFYFEPDKSNHEVSCYGSVADIKNQDGITEIQTKSFVKLIPKLEKFLPEEKVRVIYPVIENKLISRVDTETGECLPPRKSPRKGRISDALSEISMIRRFIPHPNLEIVVLTVDIIETRRLKGKIRVGRKKTEKIDAIPTALNFILTLSNSEDYRALLPEGLPSEFTSSEFERISKLKNVSAHGALSLFLQLGILSRERNGREAYRYRIK